jgi:hypothetical protein
MTAFMRAPRRRDWIFLAGMGVLVPALVAWLRALVFRCTILGALLHGFIPLTEPTNGIEPHPLYCAMHDLTHPILLLVYAAALVWLPLRARTIVFSRHRGAALYCTILLLHIGFMSSYCASVFLPVYDPVSIIKYG